MAFDITDVLSTVSKTNPGQEQIIYIPLQNLDPDPDNFYSLEGLEDLADNISLIGLQQPLRIRPGRDGHYVIVSGHRRRAAIMLIQDGDTDNAHMFDGGVPCIIDNDECSPAMRELRVIFANSSTRVLSPSEISRQAERVEALFYQLSEEGVEFKGRMRDHVAKACAVSASKLGRLHAIRTNMIPALLEYFDKGWINESEAYELQKLPASGQEEIVKSIKRSGDACFISLHNAEHCAKYAEKFMEQKTCPNGDACDHHEKRFVQALRTTYYYDMCNGACCMKCHIKDTCSHACAKAKVKQKVLKEEKKAEKAAEDERRAAADAATQQMYRQSRQRQALRLLPLIEKQHLGDQTKLPGRYSWEDVTVKTVKKQADGDFGSGRLYDGNLLSTDSDQLKKAASQLGCTVDYLLGLSDDPYPAVSKSNTRVKMPSGWQTGDPAELGEYVVIYGISTEEAEATRSVRAMRWDGDDWVNPKTGVQNIKGMNVYRWVKI